MSHPWGVSCGLLKGLGVVVRFDLAVLYATVFMRQLIL